MELRHNRRMSPQVFSLLFRLAALAFFVATCSCQNVGNVPEDVAPSGANVVPSGSNDAPPGDGVAPPGDEVAPPGTGVAAEPPVDDSLSSLPVTHVRKCLCNATELMENNACVEHPQLVDAVHATPFNITVEDLTCQPPLTKVILSADDFTPVEEGAIYVPILDSFVPLADHCIEYKFNLYGELTMEAKVCFATPQVPVCCAGGATPLLDDAEGLSCDNTDTKPFTGVKETEAGIRENAGTGVGLEKGEEPAGGIGTRFTGVEEPTREIGDIRLPIYVGGSPVDFGALNTFVWPVACNESEKLTSTSIANSDQAALGYALGMASLDWITPNGKTHHLNADQFCLSRSLEEETYTGFFCYRNPLDDHHDACKGQVCVRKCCPPGSIYFNNIGCTEFPDPGSWIPPMHDRHTLKPLETVVPVVEVYGPPICAQIYALDSDLPFLLTDDGHLSLLHGPLYPPYMYCLDNMVSDNGSVTTIALACFNDTEESNCYWQGIVQMVALALSCAFIVATLFVYISVTEIFRRLPSKCVVCEGLSLLLSFLGLIILQAMSVEPNSIFCVATGLVFYYATLASFFWLNVMCFDMFFTFKSAVREGGSQRKWLVRYCAYGWGAPFVLLVAVCVVDNLPYDPAYFGVIRPNIFTACHIPTKDYSARWLYMYMPMLTLLAVNTALFVYVAVVLVRQQRENARVLQGNDSQARAGGKSPHVGGGRPRESAVLCLKLFVVMGVTWVTEIISFADGNPCYVWVATDIINCSRGLFIFVIFVCKRDVLKKFEGTWGPRVPPICRRCPLRGGGAPRPKDVTDSVESSSVWTSRKTSHTSLFGFPGRRKTSTASVPQAGTGGECVKMATVKECNSDSHLSGE